MSITQVAQRAGVSPSTVSRYLRGTLSVSADTATRITEAARALNYSPRDTLENDSLALVLPDLRNPFYSSMGQSITDAAYAAGYQLDIKVTQGNAANESNIVDRIAQERKYCGLLYAGLNSSNAALRRIRPAGMRLVLLDEQLDEEAVAKESIVTVDNYSGAYQAVRYLISLGHQHIAYLSGPENLSTSRERLRGYIAALNASAIPVDKDAIFSGPYTEEFGSSIFTYLIENPNRPTAIFCGSDIAAVGLLGAASQYGLRIPDDLSVIGCDGIHIGQWLKPGLTTLQQPIDDIAKNAIALITSESEPRTIQLPLNLIIRHSTARHTS